MPSRSRNERELSRWADRLRVKAAADGVRAGQAVLAEALRRRVPDRKGRPGFGRLAHAGPAVLVTPVRVGPEEVRGSVYVGARFAGAVDAVLAGRGDAVTDAVADRLRGGGF